MMNTFAVIKTSQNIPQWGTSLVYQI